MAFMSSLITSGHGKGLVVATGSRTLLGSIATTLSTSSEPATVLQKEIGKFVLKLGGVALCTALLLVVW